MRIAVHRRASSLLSLLSHAAVAAVGPRFHSAHDCASQQIDERADRRACTLHAACLIMQAQRRARRWAECSAVQRSPPSAHRERDER